MGGMGQSVSTSFEQRPCLRPIQLVLRLLIWGLSGRGVKLTTQCIKCRGQEFVELYHRSHVRVYGVVLNCQRDHFKFSSPEDEFCESGSNNSGHIRGRGISISSSTTTRVSRALIHGVNYYLLLLNFYCVQKNPSLRKTESHEPSPHITH